MSDFDAIVVGAGFSGLRTLLELRERGLTARLFEAGTDVGGTWYWNRYPGARTDTESWCYAYQFSPELQREWTWTERFPTQPETLEYLRHVADRFDLRRDIVFETTVDSAHYDEAASQWIITTNAREAVTATYFIPATGVLSVPYKPDFPGLEDFTGEWVLTGNWPKEGVQTAGKRVICIGTGASGVQVIPIVAKTAEHLTVMQRTPNYVLPGRNFPLSDDDRRDIQANYDQIWAQVKEHFFAFPMSSSGRLATTSSDEERRKVFEQGWEIGGFRFAFETFDDILVSLEANEYASEFVRDKIRSIVDDPDTAELLCPKDYPLFGKRPPLGHFYYEAFNRPNVSLVDVRDNPITAITTNGVRTADGTVHEADLIIFATGFDAGTGALTRIDVRGRGGVSLAEKWSEGPRTHLGIAVDGFPNMFLVAGPQTSFANIPPVIEGVVRWIGDAIDHLQSQDLAVIEATSAGAEGWDQQVQGAVNATVLLHGKNSWFLGDNIPGKPHRVLYYFGGASNYRRACEAVAESGYEGFVLT
jgi:cation diffusion facilitator CzcD-associated flavoprotein CzcO